MAAGEHTYVFIDESGDPGFKLDRGSTQVFCLAAVILRSDEDIDATGEVIRALRERLGLKSTHEFHFHNEPMRFRKAFCEAVRECPFAVRAIAVDKDRIYRDSMLRKSPDHFYNFLTKMLLKHSFGCITNARVCIDGSMNRELKTYLRRELNRESKVIHDTKFVDSRRSLMIQLADMVAGSIARSYNKSKRDNVELRLILRPRIQDVWDFGKRQMQAGADTHVRIGPQKPT